MNRVIILLMLFSAGIVLAVSDLEAHVTLKDDLSVCSFTRVAPAVDVEMVKASSIDFVGVDFLCVKLVAIDKEFPSSDVDVTDIAYLMNKGGRSPPRTVSLNVNYTTRKSRRDSNINGTFALLTQSNWCDIPLPEG